MGTIVKAMADGVLKNAMTSIVFHGGGGGFPGFVDILPDLVF